MQAWEARGERVVLSPPPIGQLPSTRITFCERKCCGVLLSCFFRSIRTVQKCQVTTNPNSETVHSSFCASSIFLVSYAAMLETADQKEAEGIVYDDSEDEHFWDGNVLFVFLYIKDAFTQNYKLIAIGGWTQTKMKHRATVVTPAIKTALHQQT